MKLTTRMLLLEASNTGAFRGYKRQVGSDIIKSLPDNTLFPITSVTVRRNRYGTDYPPHVRVTVVTDPEGTTYTLDMDRDLYLALPDREELKV